MFKNTEEKMKHFTKELKSIFKKLNGNVEMKYIVSKIKKSVGGFNGRLDPAEERISEFEDMSIEIFR